MSSDENVGGRVSQRASSTCGGDGDDDSDGVGDGESESESGRFTPRKYNDIYLTRHDTIHDGNVMNV